MKILPLVTQSHPAVEEGSKRPSKSLKGSKLRRTSNLTFSKTGLRSNYLLEKQ